MSFILILFLIFRFFDFLIAYFSTRLIPYLGFFPYKEMLLNYHLPNWITGFANFDGAHYISIAQNGYFQYQQAFFPLYPLLIRFLSPVFNNNHLITGLIISNLFFLLGLFIFYKYFDVSLSHSGKSRQSRDASRIRFWSPPRTRGPQNDILWVIIFLLLFPTSFFFGALYNEGLFFFLFISSLYFLKKENYWLASIFAFFASLTRLIGIFLIIPFLFTFFKHSAFNIKHLTLNFKRYSLKYVITLISPILGLFFYCLYLWQTTGDPFFFFNSQPIFGANRSTHLILLPQVYYRYLKIFITANHDFRYYISVFEFLIFNLVFVVLMLDLINIIKMLVSECLDCKGSRQRASPLKLSSENIKKKDSVLSTSQLYQSYQNEHWREGKSRQDPLTLLGLNIFSLINLLLPTLTGTLSSIPRYALLSISFFIFLAEIKKTWIKIFIACLFLIVHAIVLGFFIQGYFVS